MEREPEYSALFNTMDIWGLKLILFRYKTGLMLRSVHVFNRTIAHHAAVGSGRTSCDSYGLRVLFH